MEIQEHFPSHSIAIVGLGGKFPSASNLEEFWQNIKAGVESIETFTEADLDAAGVAPRLRANEQYVRRGTVLQDAAFFDAGFFGMSPREAQLVDPQQRVFLECAWEALEHAGYAPGTSDMTVGVYAGASMNTYIFSQVLRNPELMAAAGGYQLMLGNDKDFLCTRASYKLDLRGPSMTVQTACSTSLVAVHVACRALERRECDMAIAGGVSLSFPERGGYLFQEGMILSPDGHCRPFDAAARGTRAGAGCGIVVLKRLTDALADRDTIHAVIRGIAVNNDGGGKAGYTAPSIDGQVEAVATAQHLARVEPRSIEYLEAHGTATPLGDPIEIAALTQVFRAATPDVAFCRLGSLKANLGHLDAAAGVAGLIKAILVLKHKEFPPLVNFEKPNPQLGLESSPFLASGSGAPWPAGSKPRRAGVSSFGIGGTNAHAVLQEAPDVPDATSSEVAAQLIVLSARNLASLEEVTSRLALHLQSHPEQSLADVAWTLQAGRRAFAHRRIFVARDKGHALDLLKSPGRPPVYSAVHEGADRGVVFLFSGQGSQVADMGSALYRNEQTFRDAVDRCSEVLKTTLGRDLRKVLFAPADDLTINETRYAQPALFAFEYALTRLWQHWGVRPAAMLGHSIGEYVAAHVAGVMSLEDALKLVAARGALMQELPGGTMAAVQLDAASLQCWLNEEGPGVEIAAINAPRMCTIAGTHNAMSACLGALKTRGIEARSLHTSHAFHSSMLDPVMDPFKALVEKVKLTSPKLPYISNVTGNWISASEATSPDYYAQHLRQTVQFELGVRTLAQDTTLHFLEVGPGNSLTSLTRLCLGPEGARRTSSSFPAGKNLHIERGSMLETAGRLWSVGVGLNWAGLHGGENRRRVPLPTYPFERKKHWVEAVASATIIADTNAGTPTRNNNIEDWLFTPTWLRASASKGIVPSLTGVWLVLGGSEALAGAVADRIAKAGGESLRVRDGSSYAKADDGSYQLRVGNAEDGAMFGRDLRKEGRKLAGAIILSGLNVKPDSQDRKVLQLYHAQVALASSLPVSIKTPIRLLVATAGIYSVLDEPVSDVGAAIALGPVLALPTEIEGLSSRLVDVDPHTSSQVDDVAKTLVLEAAMSDGENQTAWRSGRRWLLRYESCYLQPTPSEVLPLKQGAVVLITGGLGGMGLVLAERLVTRRMVRLLLTTRGAVPPRAEWNAILEAKPFDELKYGMIRGLLAIEAAGGEFEVVTADVSDEAGMRKAVAVGRKRWGTIDAVIHAAGVPGRGELSVLKVPEDIDAVFSPKIAGLDILLKVLGDASLDLVVLMSSINSVIGTPGAGDYAAANAVLDAFVDSDKRPPNWKRVMSFNWGAWRDVGMAAKLQVPEARRDAWTRHLQAGIETSNGLDLFERVLNSPQDRMVIIPFDLKELLKQSRIALEQHARLYHAIEQSASANSPPGGREISGEADSDGEATPIEVRVAAIWRELLGVDQISSDDDFFELGGHSLLATRVLARLEERLGAQLVLRDLFDASTLGALAAKIEASYKADENREEIEF
jgi:phthiocerol/phenolphthiocerol synthesis type-I polyketide synthase E